MSSRDPHERRHRQRVAALVGAIAVVAGAAVAIGLGYAIGGGSENASPAKASATAAARTDQATISTSPRASSAPEVAPATPPVVWVQAGHVPPGEPGYRAQTGSSGEAEFNTRVRDAVIRLLERRGVDARPLGARVDPMGAAGAAFVSIHHDSPGGPASVGYAVQGTENYYHGEGDTPLSPTPYPDSAPHRTPATIVTPAVQAASKALAESVARSFSAVYTRSNGAYGSNTGVANPDANRRMMHFYGYYRTNAQARMLIECGSQSNDAKFLANTPLVSRAIAEGILNYLDGAPASAAPDTGTDTGPAPEASGGTSTGKAVLAPKGA